MAYNRPKTPIELLEQRAQLLDDTHLWDFLTAQMISDSRQVDPFLTRGSLGQANLWWIGTDCCDLLAEVAPTMPPVTLDPDFVPDVHGFAFFERPLVGRDAADPDRSVSFDAVHWMPEFLHGGLPSLAIIMWAHPDNPQLVPTPLGRSDWPYGFDTDHELTDLPATAQPSIIEDRRLLAALWQLTSQPELVASSEQRPYRAAAKRLARKGYDPSPVRLVYLNRRTGRRNRPSTATREYTCRWWVGPHKRNACLNPRGHATGDCEHEDRPVRLHLRGPADKPLRITDTVKIWNRP